jgi:WD40 repeat protein
VGYQERSNHPSDQDQAQLGVCSGDSGNNEHAAKIWDAETGELLITISNGLHASVDLGCKEFADLRFSWQWQNLNIRHSHMAASWMVTNSQDAVRAITEWKPACECITARLWNLETNLPVGPLLQHKVNQLYCATFSTDAGSLLVTCGDSMECICLGRSPHPKSCFWGSIGCEHSPSIMVLFH